MGHQWKRLKFNRHLGENWMISMETKARLSFDKRNFQKTSFTKLGVLWGCLRADVSYFLCCTRKRDPFPRATKEIGDVCTQASRTRKETLTPWSLDRKIGCLLTIQRGNWSFRPKVDSPDGSSRVLWSFGWMFICRSLSRSIHPTAVHPGLSSIRPMGQTTTIRLSHSPITPFFFLAVIARTP